jgi:hypothetical protein
VSVTLPKLFLVLCAYLLVWVPLNFALLAERSLPSLRVRGAAATFELLAHGMVALLCIVAGRMLWTGKRAGRWFATVALPANAAASIQSLHASALPHDVPPALVKPLMAVAVVNASLWLTYLYTSARVRGWLDS